MSRKTRCEYDSTFVDFIDETGKRITRSKCSGCGKWHKGTFGINISFNVPNHLFGGRVKLCHSCAKEVAPLLNQIAQKIDYGDTPKDESEIGKKCNEEIAKIFKVNKF